MGKYKTNEATKRYLQDKFKEVANGYLLELCNMWNLSATYGYWVSDKVGGTYIFCDENPINFEEIVYVVDNDIEYQTYVEWIEYVCFAGEFGLTAPNLESWCKGCPRLSDEQQARLRGLRNDLNAAIKECKENF